jgi:hypothetical protein
MVNFYFYHIKVKATLLFPPLYLFNLAMTRYNPQKKSPPLILIPTWGFILYPLYYESVY